MSTRIFALVITTVLVYIIGSFLYGQATQMGANLTACIDQIGSSTSCQTTAPRTGAWTPAEAAPPKMLPLAK